MDKGNEVDAGRADEGKSSIADRWSESCWIRAACAEQERKELLDHLGVRFQVDTACSACAELERWRLCTDSDSGLSSVDLNHDHVDPLSFHLCHPRKGIVR